MAIALDYRTIDTTGPIRRAPRLHVIEGGSASPVRRVRSANHPTMRPRPVSSAVYARRRLAAFGLLVAILALAVTTVVGATGSRADADPAVAGVPMEPQYVIAQPGDTLWAIAQRIAPQANTAELVDELVRLNGDAIAAGQQVRIP
jgi:hypothetical protein